MKIEKFIDSLVSLRIILGEIKKLHVIEEELEKSLNFVAIKKQIFGKINKF